MKESLNKISEYIWELPQDHLPGMRVPGRIFAGPELFASMEDGVVTQLANVCHLPGIVDRAYCMPDGHWGYGFPIGGVAATDPSQGGVISPGGIGFDINCGMRLLRTNLTYDQVKPRINKLLEALFRRIPVGVGGKGMVKLNKKEFCEMLEQGSQWALERGYARQEDLLNTEDNGCVPGADAAKVSDKCIERGIGQVGSLGSGNHYLEIQVVRANNVYDKQLAESFGLNMSNQIAIMFHCGSRGFGHQVATDYLRSLLAVMPGYGISLPDRELACVPLESPEGQDYFAAMKCAVNMAYVNRQLITHGIREVFAEVFGLSQDELGIDQVYDVCHNTAKLEEHIIAGTKKRLLVHRKGATRAFGPDRPELPQTYRKTGQPVIIGGSMETGSYLLAGCETSSNPLAFASTAHGSGRLMSRTKAKSQFNGKDLVDELKAKGIAIRCASYAGLAEEAGAAYKDINSIVDTISSVKLSLPVVRLVPVGNIKG
ncbi:MAG: RtcB family protein, partial [Sedimentisphaerales bacterium]|nr:RtcB family protein [Sedimentisphaerales bacterium]MBN2844092.1 RtcB family protein [Sedimentisphaerales bacterium]